jgi:hypothetical protein
MIPKSCRLCGQDHTTKQAMRAKWRFDLLLIPFRSKKHRRLVNGSARLSGDIPHLDDWLRSKLSSIIRSTSELGEVVDLA